MSPQPAEPEAAPRRWRQISLNDRLIVVFTAVIAVATLFYTGFAGWQLWEIHKATIINNRAWVGLNGSVEVSALSLDPNNAKGSYSLTLRNFGSSAAFHVVISSRVIIRSFNAYPSLVTTCNEASSSSAGKIFLGGQPEPIGQGTGDLLFPSQQTTKYVQDQSIEDLNRDSMKGVYVVGCIAYEDQFGNAHRTRFFYGILGQDYDRLTFPSQLGQFLMFNDAN